MGARNRDHLMVPFQCELCHFRNIYGREPELQNFKDKEFFTFARRASLNTFQSREPPTIWNNLKELNRMKRTEERFGFDCTTPPLGPFLVNDDLGMKAIVAILDRSLYKGTYGHHVQCATFRKLLASKNHWILVWFWFGFGMVLVWFWYGLNPNQNQTDICIHVCRYIIISCCMLFF